MAARPEVTVVIPTRNRRELVAQTLASVARQSSPAWEAVVVDDASEDDTWGWLCAIQDARVRPTRLTEKSERAAARNAGLAEARGACVLFLDDDDQLPPRALETHLAALRRHPDAIASIGGYEMFGEGVSAAEVPIVGRAALRPILHDVLFGWMAVSGQCVFRTETLRAIGGWDGAWIPIEDHVLLLEAARRGPVALLPDILLLYRVHPGQWRPENLREMMTEVRERALAGWPEAERSLGRRILEGRAVASGAHQRYHQGRRLAALALFARTFWMLPSVRRSPVVRRQLLEAVLKCVVGGRGVHILKRIRLAARAAPSPRHELEVALGAGAGRVARSDS